MEVKKTIQRLPSEEPEKGSVKKLIKQYQELTKLGKQNSNDKSKTEKFNEVHVHDIKGKWEHSKDESNKLNRVKSDNKLKSPSASLTNVTINVNEIKEKYEITTKSSDENDNKIKCVNSDNSILKSSSENLTTEQKNNESSWFSANRLSHHDVEENEKNSKNSSNERSSTSMVTVNERNPGVIITSASPVDEVIEKLSTQNSTYKYIAFQI